MREQLVAYAEDCIVRGEVELGDGRLSDALNASEVIRFEAASLEALDDGRVVRVDELDVEPWDIHLVEAHGRRGDPTRRLRTVEERVVLQVGPFTVTGSLHRAPHTQPLAALSRWTKFIPVTDAEIALASGGAGRREEVILVNRDRVSTTEALAVMAPDELGEAPRPRGRVRRG